MTRTRHTPEYLASNVIHTNRFDTDRERRAKMQDEYRRGLAELNAPLPDMEQLDATRGPDPVGEDVRTVIATVLIGAVVFGMLVWAVIA